MRSSLRVALVVAVAVLAGAAAHAKTRPSDQNQPRSDFERETMHSLACTCPTCNREPIDECTCELAAQMRGDVQKQLAGRDLSTAAARTAAREAVRASVAGTFGAAALTPSPPRRAAELDWLPIFIFAGGLLLLVMVTRRSLARRRAEKAAGSRYH